MFWGNHLRYFGDKISLNGRPSPISLILRQNNAKHYRHYFDCRGVATNLKNSSLRGESQIHRSNPQKKFKQNMIKIARLILNYKEHLCLKKLERVMVLESFI